MNSGDTMRIVFDDFIHDTVDELKEYLLLQLGITDVKYNIDNSFIVFDIKHNEKTTPEIVMAYADLFLDNRYSLLVEFDKETKGEFKTMKYVVDDMCCDYCFRNFIMNLFENKNIKSVKSNFDYRIEAYNVEFIIEYDETYSEEELIEYIKEKI